MKAKITTAVFLSILVILSTLTILLPKQSKSENENRILQTFPTLSIDTIISGQFGEELEVYLSDHFVSRDSWISFKTMIELALGKKDINGVYFVDDYLIERHKETDFDEERIATNLSAIEKFMKENSDKNINVILPPSTSYVYSDKLPKFANGFDEAEFLSRVQEIAGDSYVDVSEVLKENSNEYIYYKTDHHWTTQGASLAYNYFAEKEGLTKFNGELEKATDEFFGTVYSKVNYSLTKPDDIYFYDNEQKLEVEYNLDCKIFDNLYNKEDLETKDKYAFFLNGNNPITTIKTEAKNDKVLLVAKDSFSHCFIPFLMNDYSKIIVVDYRYNRGSTKQLMQDENVTDVLILYNTVSLATYDSVVNINL